MVTTEIYRVTRKGRLNLDGLSFIEEYQTTPYAVRNSTGFMTAP